MASSYYYSFRCLMPFFLLSLYLAMAAEPNLPFLFKNFGKDSNFALYGEAMVANDSMSVQMGVSRDGMIIYKKPINLKEVISGNMVSFSTNFVFSMSREDGNGLAFIMLPFSFLVKGFHGGSMGMFWKRKMKFLAVEFDSFRDGFVSVKMGNVSSMNNLGISGGEKLQAWIDYEASSKRIEVRFNKFSDEIKPVDPLLSCSIDLSKFWEGDEISVGLSSSSGDSSVYSWSFGPRSTPHWMHSEALDPEDFAGKEEDEGKVYKRSGNCVWRILGDLVFGAGCGALGALFLFLVWTIFGSVQTKELEYDKKSSVSARKTIQDGNIVGV